MRNFLWGLAVVSIWTLAALVLAAGLTVPLGVFAAVVGAVLAHPLGGVLARSRLRLPVIWAGGALAALLVILASWVLTSGTAPYLIGSRGAYLLSEATAWFCLPLLVIGVLRASSTRVRSLVVLEAAFMGGIFAALFAAHRGGFINRPYFLVDPLWARGYDPLPFFLAFGTAIAGLLVILVVHRGSAKRSFFDAGILLAIIAVIFLVFPIGKLKDIPPPFGGGKSGQGKNQQAGKQGGKGEQGGQGQSGGQGQGQGSGSSGGQGGKGGQGGQGDQGGTSQAGGSQGGSGSVGAMSSFSNQQASSSGNPPVAVVLFRDDYDPPVGYYYFRQTAFSQYNGQRLVQDTSGRADLDVASAFPTEAMKIPPAWTPKRVPVKKDELPYSRPLETTVALLSTHTRPFALINPVAIIPKANPDPKRFQRAYDVRSEVIARTLPDVMSRMLGSKGWSEEVWKHYTEAPSDPRFAELADQIVASLKPEYQKIPLAQALAIKFWLDKNCVYSLTSTHEEAGDPLGDFLFGDRTGHCVFMAHSACLLFRARGIPARVGAGYAVDARNRAEGSALMVRERDAHAWPEIYIEGPGWIPLDISPEKSLAPAEDAPDQGLQQMLGEMARQGAGNPKQEQSPAGEGDLQEVLKNVAKAAGLALALLCLLGFLGLYGAKIYRRYAVYFRGPQKVPLMAYRGSLDRLADTGRLRAYGQTRESFAGGLSESCPSFQRLTFLHLESTLGRGTSAAKPERCFGLYESAGREIRSIAPWWRRALGTLNPFSFLRVK